MSRRALAPAVAVVLVVAGSACGSDGSTCPRDSPATCPSTVPSYQNDIAPLFKELCVDCHSPTGQAPDRPLETYGEVFARRTTVVSLTTSCQMPPPDFPQPTEAERVAILTWFICGAPNN